MDKIKIGIPRALFYYYYIDIWRPFFEELNCEIVESPETNKQILDYGIKYSNDEMCFAFKIYIGHIFYLLDKCDYLLIPRIDNYGIKNQTCTNFLSVYDIINNIFNKPTLNYNIDLRKRKNELKGFMKIGKALNKSKRNIKRAYKIAKIKYHKKLKEEILINYSKLSSSKIKVLIVSYPYNIYDNYLGMPIIKCLEKYNVDMIYADKFDASVTRKLAKKLSKNLYWKFSKELIGAIKLIEGQINGIIFISSFPCGPDSLVNELVMRKIKVPHLNLIIDDVEALIGIETRIESFIDILKQNE